MGKAHGEEVDLRRRRAMALVQPTAQLALATALVEHRTRSTKREGADLRRSRASLLRLEQRARLIESVIEVWIPDHSEAAVAGRHRRSVAPRCNNSLGPLRTRCRTVELVEAEGMRR